MTNLVRFEDLKVRDYPDTWNYQESLLGDLVEQKKKRQITGWSDNDRVINHLLFVEHPHVYTLGKSGSENNLLINRAELNRKGVAFYRTNRGGDITYHGPGQIVGYPIFDLECFGLSLKEYINNLEESIILTCLHFGVDAGRIDGSTGVWTHSGEHGKKMKICAIGVRASHYVTMHGFAFNINTDLSYFNFINPCGFTDKGVTSLNSETKLVNDMEDVRKVLLANLKGIFSFEWV